MDSHKELHSGLEDLLQTIIAGIDYMQEHGGIQELYFAAPFEYENNLYALEIKNTSKLNVYADIQISVIDLEDAVNGFDSKKHIAYVNTDILTDGEHKSSFKTKYYNRSRFSFPLNSPLIIENNLPSIKGRNTVLKPKSKIINKINADIKKENKLAKALKHAICDIGQYGSNYISYSNFFPLKNNFRFEEELKKGNFDGAFKIGFAQTISFDNIKDNQFEDYLEGIVYMGMIGDAKIMLNQKLMPGGSNIDLVYKAVHKCKNIADKLQIEDMTDIKKQIINSLVDEYGFGALDLMVELNDYEGINFAFGKTKFKGKNTNEILTEYPELAVSIIRSKGYEPIGILDEISRIKQTPDNPKIIFEKGTYIYHVHDIQNTCPINNKEINECKKQNIKFNRGYKITNVDRGSGSFELDGLLGKFKPSDFTHYHVPK